MRDASHPLDERGFSARLSPVSVVPELPGAPNPDRWTLAVRLLRKCREAGVTTFDLAGAREIEPAAALLAEAFPRSDPEVVVIVPWGAGSRAPAFSSGARGGPPPRGGPETQGPIRGVRSRFRAVLEAELDEEGGSAASALERWRNQRRTESGAGDLALHCRSLNGLRAARRAPERPLLTAELSLLHRTLLDEGVADEPGDPPVCLARNVFADGRLDGSRWSSEAGPLRVHGRPLALREVREEYADVLDFAFLTDGRRRTLAQAAVAYVLSLPWVVSASIPLPPAERIPELVTDARSQRLAPEELAILRARREGHAPGGAVRFVK